MRHVGADVLLLNMNGNEPGVVPNIELDGLPDAAGNEARSPVPAVFVGRLAEIRFRRGVDLGLPRILSGNLDAFANGRRKDDAELVSSGLKERLNVRTPLAERVVSSEDELVVQIDLGGTVETLEDQIDVTTFQGVRCGLEGAAVFPTGVFDPLERGFVGAIEGVGDKLVVQQVGVNDTGDLRRVPGRLDRAGLVSELVKFPPIV